MTSLFISHSSRDQVAAQRVHQWLRNAGYQALFLDFDPSGGIPAGRRWEAELYAQLRRTDGVIFLASADSVASKWCFAELSLARSLGRPVFPLRLDAAAWLDLLQDVQWVDLTADETSFGQLRDGLHRAGLRPGDSFAWDPARSPFPGLEPFDWQDAAVFFGREQEIRRLIQLLTSTLLRGPGRFVAIAGPSGSGKSSLLRAGLLPRLEGSPTIGWSFRRCNQAASPCRVWRVASKRRSGSPAMSVPGPGSSTVWIRDPVLHRAWLRTRRGNG